MADKQNRNALRSIPDLNCDEAHNYPVYDPKNLDHNTACDSPRARTSRSWSPLKERESKGKLTLRSKSPSPTRMMKSSRKALCELAGTVKLKTASTRPSSPPVLLHEACPMGHSSGDGTKSKKSVHWRSSDSTTVATREEERSSPKDIVKDSPPQLPDVGYSDHFLGSAVALTARPPPTPILVALEKADQRPHRIDLQLPVLAEIQQPLLTPMPGTNLPLEDPFDSSALSPKFSCEPYEDPVNTSENGSSLEPVPYIQVLFGVHPSSVATQATVDCLDRCLDSQTSSKTHDTDDDSTTSEETDADCKFVTRVHPRPPNMARYENRTGEAEVSDRITFQPSLAVPEIKVSDTGDVSGPRGCSSILQSMLEVESTVSLGSANDESEEKNQWNKLEQACTGNQVNEDLEKSECDEGSGLRSLTEPIKHDISTVESASKQAPLVHLTTARRLPPFTLRPNVTSAPQPRDTASFRYTDSSDEYPMMEIVDETEYIICTAKKFDCKFSRVKTPSPACIPLPETPMFGAY